MLMNLQLVLVSLQRLCDHCIYQNMGRKCHDEPQENSNLFVVNNEGKLHDQVHIIIDNDMGSSLEQMQDCPVENLAMSVDALPQGSMQIIQPCPVSEVQSSSLNEGGSQCSLNDWSQSHGSQYHEVHNFLPSYTFNAPEVTTEYNLLDEFLNNSLLDDGTLLPSERGNFYLGQPSDMIPNALDNQANPSGPQSSSKLFQGQLAEQQISRPTSVIPGDKSCEYYLQAADPTGNDTPEERMQRLLQAKYDAGMLKPYNSLKGYARLSTYMDQHFQPSQKQKVLQHLERFRSQFRENVQSLTESELTSVEMWFEYSLLECDRAFASMAIPACCWRRTGEIFLGNKEMAELIRVPIEKLRDGKIALHEILVEESLVSYWEKFGAMAFDQGQKSVFTSCFIEAFEDNSEKKKFKCCFSFNIKRDDHKM
ncbi:BgTH12-03672 [Blumeria graminis f. sp. triticale]|uniref:Bgt-4102 n=3 Tax=Blumeria graminis TaxID=34373 RepID=A0A9X9L8U4_BLUGR|nr:BgTH12-03672 [Blumeria graminis f. sp. triticale]VCU39728.1 Bgt-4102 [Blumeria graminis f. sp. tritici]